MISAESLKILEDIQRYAIVAMSNNTPNEVATSSNECKPTVNDDECNSNSTENGTNRMLSFESDASSDEVDIKPSPQDESTNDANDTTELWQDTSKAEQDQDQSTAAQDTLSDALGVFTRSTRKRRNVMSSASPLQSQSSAGPSVEQLQTTYKWYEHVLNQVGAIVTRTAYQSLKDIWDSIKGKIINPLSVLYVPDGVAQSALFIKTNLVIIFQTLQDLTTEVRELRALVMELRQLKAEASGVIPLPRVKPACSTDEDVHVVYPDNDILLSPSEQWMYYPDAENFRPVHLYMVYVAFITRQAPSKKEHSSRRVLTLSVQVKQLSDSFVGLFLQPNGNHHWTLSDKTPKEKEGDGPIPLKFPEEMVMRFAALASMLLQCPGKDGTNTPRATLLMHFKYQLRHSLNDLHRPSRNNVKVFSDSAYKHIVMSMETYFGMKVKDFGCPTSS